VIRRTLRILGSVMIVAGVLMLAWAVTVWQWQDPFTAVLHSRDQRSLERTFERQLQRHDRPQVIASASPEEIRTSVAREAARWRKRNKEGGAIARLRVPRLGLTEIVVNGTAAKTLKRGPGRYLGTAMPGEGELVYIAGHRTTYGAPFAHITRLRPGDRVFLEMPYGTFEYAITGHRIVDAHNLSVLKSKGLEQVVLQACHPRFFASQRYLAYAKPVGVTLPGASRQTPLEALG
jgi:sortase A